jgi:hypothetical protein
MKNVEIVLWLAIFAIFVAWYSSITVLERTFQSQAIENGAAQYNPQTGEFEWKVNK